MKLHHEIYFGVCMRIYVILTGSGGIDDSDDDTDGDYDDEKYEDDDSTLPETEAASPSHQPLLTVRLRVPILTVNNIQM